MTAQLACEWLATQLGGKAVSTFPVPLTRLDETYVFVSDSKNDVQMAYGTMVRSVVTIQSYKTRLSYERPDSDAIGTERKRVYDTLKTDDTLGGNINYVELGTLHTGHITHSRMGKDLYITTFSMVHYEN